jgi:hypothetical protein
MAKVIAKATNPSGNTSYAFLSRFFLPSMVMTAAQHHMPVCVVDADDDHAQNIMIYSKKEKKFRRRWTLKEKMGRHFVNYRRKKNRRKDLKI